MRIGVLTGGGDVPGLNPCIKAIVGRASGEGHEVIGIRRGWGGLVSADPDDPPSLAGALQPLGLQTVRTIDRSGGTFLTPRVRTPGGSEAPIFRPGPALSSAAMGPMISPITSSV